MKKLICVIAAVSLDGVYSVDGEMPWHSKVDFANFRTKTTGHTVIMGRRTWESLPGKFRPLPDRHNIVVSQGDIVSQGASLSRNLSEAIELASTEKVFVIGGARLWYEAMETAREAFVTIINKSYRAKSGEIQTAEYLTRPFDRWEGFSLNESIHKIEIMSGEMVPLDFLHWKR